MAAISVDPKKLLEAGAHFGHKTSRWHPAMRPYIHSKRGDSHVIDLTQTAAALEEALRVIEKAVEGGSKVLLVSTKRQAKDVIQQTADATSMPFVVNRWLGGMLTNSRTMNERIKHLKKQEQRMESGELAAKYNKLEVQQFQEEIDVMNGMYGGIKDLPGKPAVVFVVDILHDKNAVAEATKLNIPVVGLVDTNGDPRTIKYPVPCNDDALKTIELVCAYVQQAIEAGKSKQKAAPADVIPQKTAVKVESVHQKKSDVESTDKSSKQEAASKDAAKSTDDAEPKADDKKTAEKKEG